MVGRAVERGDHLLLEALARVLGALLDGARLELDGAALVVIVDLLGAPFEVEERLEKSSCVCSAWSRTTLVILPEQRGTVHTGKSGMPASSSETCVDIERRTSRHEFSSHCSPPV